MLLREKKERMRESKTDVGGGGGGEFHSDSGCKLAVKEGGGEGGRRWRGKGVRGWDGRIKGVC